ncbi:MAG: phosphoenolpyruvate--protein phosphotransferase [candidate division Zixibacteria bacterium]
MIKENFKIKCVPVSGGLAIGEVQVVRDPTLQVVRRAIPQQKIKSEVVRLETALEKTVSELELARNKAVRAIGDQGANVFDAQVMIASDKKFQENVIATIQDERVNAEYAFQEILAETLSRLQKSRDPYLRQMINDIKSVSERVLSLLLGVGEGIQNDFKKSTVLVGRIFSPGQVMSYSKKKVVGFLTEEGGPTSHMGLIMRSLGIPAVMTDINIAESLSTGMTMIIDGNNGEVILNPDSGILRNYQRIRSRKRSQPFAVLSSAKSIVPITRDGHRYGLAANLEIPGPLDEHLIRLGIGVGLYRTEFLYFNDQLFPSEEEQYQNYSRIAEKFRPLPVTLRTFDLGGDKYADGMENLQEENPALGWRGIRVSLDSSKQLKTQIRAILRASVSGNIRILLPMVSDAPEIISTRNLIKSVKNELKRSRIPFDDNISVGAMIEIPSAAMQADYLAELVDFFSIGTNDLIQYTMAADRANHRVAKYYTPHHPSVLKLIQMTVLAAHDNGIPVAVCGEMAGDKNMAPFFVGLGVDELSMNPTLIPGVADWISHIDYIQAKRFVSRLMRLTTVKKVTRALREASEYTRQQKKGSWL